MWPKIAAMFDMEWADPIPMSLATYMTDKTALRETIARKYDLQDIPYDKIASWPFGDLIFNNGFDNISSTIKARQAGSHACLDTEDMFAQQSERLRRAKVIPPIG